MKRVLLVLVLITLGCGDDPPPDVELHEDDVTTTTSPFEAAMDERWRATPRDDQDMLCLGYYDLPADLVVEIVSDELERQITPDEQDELFEFLEEHCG